MAAPKGNKFWELRSKHGRDKLFTTPALLWEAACEYFTWCEENPLIEIDFRGKDANQVELPKMNVPTLHGLVLYCEASTSFWREFRKNCTEKNEKDFLSVITRVEEIIYHKKFTGAAAGFLKENIIARDLGLADKKEFEGKIDIEQITGMQIK